MSQPYTPGTLFHNPAGRLCTVLGRDGAGYRVTWIEAGRERRGTVTEATIDAGLFIPPPNEF